VTEGAGEAAAAAAEAMLLCMLLPRRAALVMSAATAPNLALDHIIVAAMGDDAHILFVVLHFSVICWLVFSC
jgi:hypothetical protein